MAHDCNFCEHLKYDDEQEDYYCDVSIDEDDLERYLSQPQSTCAYFKFYDEYKMVEKQN